MYIDIDRLMYNMEEELSKPQYILEEMRQFVETDKSKDYEEDARVSVMAINICTSYIGTDKKNIQTIYKTVRKAIVKILSNDRHFCQEYFFIGKYVVAFFNTPVTLCIDDVLEYAALLNAIISGLNSIAKKKYGVVLSANIGIDFGNVLRINKHQDRYTVKETFHGYPINNAIRYSDQHIDDKGGNIIISESVKHNLKGTYQAYFKSYDDKFFVSKLFESRVFNWIKGKYPEINENSK